MQQISLEVLEDVLQRELPKNEKEGKDTLNHYLDLSNWKYGVLKLDKVTIRKGVYDSRYTVKLHCITPKGNDSIIEGYDVSSLLNSLKEKNIELIKNNNKVLSKLLYLLTVKFKNEKDVIYLYKDYFTKSGISISIIAMYYTLSDIDSTIDITLLYTYRGEQRYMILECVGDLATELDEKIERIGR